MPTTYNITLSCEQYHTVLTALYNLAEDYKKTLHSCSHDFDTYFMQRLMETQELYKELMNLPF